MVRRVKKAWIRLLVNEARTILNWTGIELPLSFVPRQRPGDVIAFVAFEAELPLRWIVAMQPLPRYLT